MNIEIQTLEPRVVLSDLYGNPKPSLGTTIQPIREIELKVLDNGSKNMLGTTTIWLAAKFLTLNLSTNAQALLISLLANVIYNAATKVSNAVLKVDDKVVVVEKEQIEIAIKEYVRLMKSEEE